MDRAKYQPVAKARLLEAAGAKMTCSAIRAQQGENGNVLVRTLPAGPAMTEAEKRKIGRPFVGGKTLRSKLTCTSPKPSEAHATAGTGKSRPKP